MDFGGAMEVFVLVSCVILAIDYIWGGNNHTPRKK